MPQKTENLLHIVFKTNRFHSPQIETILQGLEEHAFAVQPERGSKALQSVAELNPDVVLMDVNMLGMNGIETTAKIRGQFSHPTIIGLTMHQDQTTIEKLREAGAG